MDYSDEYFANQTLDVMTKHDSYTKWSARLEIADQDNTWEVAVIAETLTDERVFTQSTPLPLVGLLTGGSGIAYNGIYERPRNIALQAKYNF